MAAKRLQRTGRLRQRRRRRWLSRGPCQCDGGFPASAATIAATASRHFAGEPAAPSGVFPIRPRRRITRQIPLCRTRPDNRHAITPERAMCHGDSKGMRGAMIGGGVERVEGIEPSYSAWKAAALPLSYTRMPCEERSGAAGGGGRTRTYEGVARGFTVLPLCRSGHSSVQTACQPHACQTMKPRVGGASTPSLCGRRALLSTANAIAALRAPC